MRGSVPAGPANRAADVATGVSRIPDTAGVANAYAAAAKTKATNDDGLLAVGLQSRAGRAGREAIAGRGGAFASFLVLSTFFDVSRGGERGPGLASVGASDR